MQQRLWRINKGKLKKKCLEKGRHITKNSKRNYKKWPAVDTGLSRWRSSKKEYARNRFQMSEEDTQKLRKHKKKRIHCMPQKELQQWVEKLRRRNMKTWKNSWKDWKVRWPFWFSYRLLYAVICIIFPFY